MSEVNDARTNDTNAAWRGVAPRNRDARWQLREAGTPPIVSQFTSQSLNQPVLRSLRDTRLLHAAPPRDSDLVRATRIAPPATDSPMWDASDAVIPRTVIGLGGPGSPPDSLPATSQLQPPPTRDALGVSHAPRAAHSWVCERASKHARAQPHQQRGSVHPLPPPFSQPAAHPAPSLFGPRPARKRPPFRAQAAPALRPQPHPRPRPPSW
jgi:hypothetical protein